MSMVTKRIPILSDDKFPYRQMCFIALIVSLTLLANIGFGQDIQGIYRLQKAKEMATAYQRLMQRSDTKKAGAKLDDLRAYIAMSYAWEDNIQQAEHFIGLLEYGPVKANKYFTLARTFKQLKKMDLAEKYARLSVDTSFSYFGTSADTLESALQPASSIAYATLLLADVMVEKKENKEAIAAIERALPYCSEKNKKGLLQRQGDILLENGQADAALEAYLDLMRAGNETEALKARIKRAYLSINGEQQSFDSYLDSTLHAYHAAHMDSLLQVSSREQAPLFELKDLDGKYISTDQLKGKIIVLDFWATWCGPCKASFPAMQQAITYYKANTNVVFLFINTLEYAPQNATEIKQYLKKNQFDFTVLLDEKDNTTKAFKVAEKFGVTAIPKKIIIDKEGFIRATLTGFSGNDASSVEELRAIIDVL